MKRIYFAISAALMMTSPVLAADDGAMPLIFSVETGVMRLQANELVYEGKKRVSQLVWDGNAIGVIGGLVQIDIDRDWRLTGKAHVGVTGENHMVDYDWLEPWYVGSGDNQWTDRSIHPDTRLDHYFDIDLAVGRTIAATDDTRFGINAGFRYTDFKMSAYGGSYIYSFSGFRDAVGDFKKGEKGISYNQKIPVLYLGADAEKTMGQWTMSANARVGFTVNAYARDDHWMRSLIFYDHFDPSLSVGAGAQIAYAFREGLAFTVSGSFDAMMRTRADTKMIDRVTNGVTRFKNGAGADYQAGMLMIGIKGSF